MLNFCKRNSLSLHSLFLSSSSSSEDHHHHHHRIRHRRFLSMDSGLSFLIVGEKRPENILESVSVKPRMKKKKKVSNSSGYCFLDEISGCGNGDNGLRSCTESLGFESSDQMEEELEEEDEKVLMMRSRNLELRRWRRCLDRNRRRNELIEDKKKKKVFPPPLSSMNENGQPKFFLKPVRRDGRLELIEVGITRTDSVLRACRQDGRLTLHLVAPRKQEQVIEEEIIQEEQEQEMIQEEQEEQEEEQEVIQEEQEEEEQEIIQEEEKIQEEEEDSWNVRELMFPLTSNITSTGEGFRRCHELNNHHHHHHHHLNMWNQHHQVTTRSTVHVL